MNNLLGAIVLVLAIVLSGFAVFFVIGVTAIANVDDSPWEYFESCYIEREGSFDYCFDNFAESENKQQITQCFSEVNDLKWCWDRFIK